VVVADRWDGHRYFPALAWRTSDGTAGQATRPASRPGPARVRWPRSRHRRTPGLRREEVAQLAGGRSDLVHVAREQGRDNRAPRRAGMDLTGRGTDLRRPVEPAPGAPDAQPAQMLRPSDRRSPACTSTSPISGSGQHSNIRVTTYTPADAEPRRAQCRGARGTVQDWPTDQAAARQLQPVGGQGSVGPPCAPRIARGLQPGASISYNLRGFPIIALARVAGAGLKPPRSGSCTDPRHRPDPGAHRRRRGTRGRRAARWAAQRDGSPHRGGMRSRSIPSCVSRRRGAISAGWPGPSRTSSWTPPVDFGCPVCRSREPST